MAPKKNTAGKWIVFAWTTATGLGKTGDAAQITGSVRIDGGADNAIDDTNPTELAGGYYIFDVTAAEMNGTNVVIIPASSTAGVQVIGVPGAVWTDAGTDQTGDSYARIGAPAGASVSADIAAIEAQTDDIGAAGAGLTAVPWNAAWDAQVESEVTDALTATIADSTPADGTRPAVASGILMLTRYMNEKAVVGTTITVNKEDGSTPAYTLTIDDATDPTTITRAS